MYPRFINTKFDSYCAETGEKLLAGTQVVYFPCYGKVFSIYSTHGRVFRRIEEKKSKAETEQIVSETNTQTEVPKEPAVAESQSDEKKTSKRKKGKAPQDDLPF